MEWMPRETLVPRSTFGAIAIHQETNMNGHLTSQYWASIAG
jgi:hypothetical protein